MMNSTATSMSPTTYKGLVNLYRMIGSYRVAVRSYSCCSELVKDLESGLVAGNAKLSLELNSRLAWSLGRHQVSAPKPRRKRSMTRLHYGSSCQRSIFLAGLTAKYDRSSSFEAVRLFF